MKQFGRAGRIEYRDHLRQFLASQRSCRTSQPDAPGSLVKELRIDGISNMEDGNPFLEGFSARYNAKFAKPLAPAKPDNLHRTLSIEPDRPTLHHFRSTPAGLVWLWLLLAQHSIAVAEHCSPPCSRYHPTGHSEVAISFDKKTALFPQASQIFKQRVLKTSKRITYVRGEPTLVKRR